jgi:hypothetical protein
MDDKYSLKVRGAAVGPFGAAALEVEVINRPERETAFGEQIARRTKVEMCLGIEQIGPEKLRRATAAAVRTPGSFITPCCHTGGRG